MGGPFKGGHKGTRTHWLTGKATGKNMVAWLRFAPIQGGPFVPPGRQHLLELWRHRHGSRIQLAFADDLGEGDPSVRDHAPAQLPSLADAAGSTTAHLRQNLVMTPLQGRDERIELF